MPQPLTLYERLGGVYPIATVVDDLIDRVMGDPRLNANPRVDGSAPSRSPGRIPNTWSQKWSAGPLADRKNTRDAPCTSRTKK
jgi:hypothetical protein